MLLNAAFGGTSLEHWAKSARDEFERYCDQRWKSTELSYGTALILHRDRASKSDSPA